MPKVRVLIVDDHSLVRTGIKLLIQTQKDIECVGEAEDGLSAVHKSALLQPDVITLDLGLKSSSGLEWVKRLQEVAKARILVLTMFDDPSFVRSALAMGVHGYLLKSSGETQFLTAIRAIAQGQQYIDATLADQISAAPFGSSFSRPIVTLSPREQEILILVAQGNTNQVAAQRMGVSVKTVESYRARLMEKLGLSNRADLTRFAVETGLLRPANANPNPASDRKTGPQNS